MQNRFNLSDRSNEDVLETCTDDGSPSCPGFPSGPETPAEWRARSPGPRGLGPRRWRSPGCCTARPSIVPIPGTSSVDHLEENVAAAELELSEEELDGLSDAA